MTRSESLHDKSPEEGLERWLSGQTKQLTVWFPTSLLGTSQLPITPAPGDPVPSSGLPWAPTHEQTQIK